MSAAFPPGAHGGDGALLAERLGVDVAEIVDLSMSLNPVAPGIETPAARHLAHLSRYPDATRATVVLAEAMGLEPAQLLITNGGAEAIALAAGVLGGGVASEPEFSLHPRSPLGARWRSNPHNPSGILAPADEIADVWDEAFYALATGTWTRGDLGRGALVVGSLTKLFACPGLRIGYLACGDEETMASVRAAQPHWAVNALAVAMLPDLVASARLEEWARTIAVLRARLVEVLVAHGLAPRRSDANWVLVDGAAGLRDGLAAQRVLVRDCSSFGLADTVRIAVPRPDDMERLERALARL